MDWPSETQQETTLLRIICWYTNYKATYTLKRSICHLTPRIYQFFRRSSATTAASSSHDKYTFPLATNANHIRLFRLWKQFSTAMSTVSNNFFHTALSWLRCVKPSGEYQHFILLNRHSAWQNNLSKLTATSQYSYSKTNTPHYETHGGFSTQELFNVLCDGQIPA